MDQEENNINGTENTQPNNTYASTVEQAPLQATSTSVEQPNNLENTIKVHDIGESTNDIGNKLVSKGLISADQLDIAFREQRTEKSRNKPIDKILVDLGFITEVALSKIIAEAKGIKNIDLKGMVLDSKVVNMIPQDAALKTKAIVIGANDDSLTLAVADIYNILAIDQLKKYLPKNIKIRTIYAPETQIIEAIEQYYKYEMSISGILKEIETGNADNHNLTSEGYINPTVRLVDALLVDGIKAGASDLHFEPEESFVRIRYRIDGKLKQIRSFHKEYWPAIAVRIKIISKMNIAENRNPQDGRITYNVLGRPIDFRVATHPTIYGENIVMRILDSRKSIVQIEDLGFSKHNASLLQKLLLRPEGIIIVTGPTGSGKTTTLYSILNYINTIEKNIMTLEDPVEYQLTLIRQSNIREGAGMNFTDGIKSLMRQDPDVIFLGEIRDMETATMAVRASMTGHQVFSTLHTNDAIGAITRLKDIGVSGGILAGNIVCIIAQRLARKLCKACKAPYQASGYECKILGVDSTQPLQIYKKNGCEQCEYIGYKGRVAINEILKVDKGLDELIATEATRKTMLEYAASNGFVRMSDDGSDKVLKGVMDIESLIGTIDMTERIV
ncbi:GspE/PulE family protein [Rickettsiales endosymbiont of Stachyamoeba lipophora]|uniref:GspE/PulE family protein n=1 Tax=Rickettsiales endosymbiont of Stachyamoeba lipophora TaxID=2486578 RepID=UPI000F647B09|nr:GspE/PulE family protein [Rickettsiales endosymbiont of Stachyamoeba lipophora]AZL15417.1 type II/IV secretion system protein [Rickettsiales endosymbiont of Stachyamoeba lipophora]